MIEHACKKMSSQQYVAVLISSSIFLYFSIKFLYKVWWTPIRIKSLMASQGVEGPSYKFIYGNSNEIRSMRFKSIAKPMNHLSHDIFSYLQPNLHSWFKNYGVNFLAWFGTRPTLVVSEPAMIKEILNDKDKSYPKNKIEGFIKKLLGDGLATTTVGEKWVKMRMLANHSFHGESLKNMLPSIVASAEKMIARWEKHDGEELEVQEEFALFTSEVISRTAFGSSYIEGKNIFDMLTQLILLIARNSYKIRLPVISKVFKSRDDKESDRLEQGIRKSILEIVKKREEAVMNGETDNFGSDFLGSLVKAYHEDDESKKISVDELIDECKTFYVAGQETTSTLLTWSIFLLAIHTDYQEEARKEVLSVFDHQTPNSVGIAKLKMLSMIINETLRLYPPVLTLIRKANREIRLGKITVPEDIQFFIPTLPLHRDTKIWGEEAHLFKPERFCEGIAKATNNNTAGYLPFGLGPRTCVGNNFAIMEAKIALSMILQNFSFTLSPTYSHSPHELLTLNPQHGVQVILHSLLAKS